VGDEPGQDVAGRPGPGKGIGERPDDTVDPALVGDGGGLSEGRIGHSVGHQRHGVVSGRGGRRVGFAGPHQLGQVDGPGFALHAHRHTGTGADEAHHRHPTGAPEAVGGRRVVGEADIGFAGLGDDHDGVVTPGHRQGLLDDLGRRGEPVAGAHRLVSARAFRTLMPPKTAVGQPWLTGATWGGCPFPQLKAPPRT
jgi:hypothetical protein